MAHLQQQEEAANRREATLEVLRRAKDKACSTDFKEGRDNGTYL